MKKMIVLSCAMGMLCNLQAINWKQEYNVNGQKEKQRIDKLMQEYGFVKRPSVRMKEPVKKQKKQNDSIGLTVQIAGVMGLSLINTEMHQPGVIRAASDKKEQLSAFVKEADKLAMGEQKAQSKAIRDQLPRVPKQLKKKPAMFHTKDTCPHQRK